MALKKLYLGIIAMFLLLGIFIIPNINAINSSNSNVFWKMDVNGDNKIDNQDLEFILGLNNTDCTTYGHGECYGADMNEDRFVNQTDIDLWQEEFNRENESNISVFLCDKKWLDNQGNDLFKNRWSNTLFDKEKIQWNVLVYDRENLTKLDDAYVTLGNDEVIGNPKQVSCIKDENISETINPECNTLSVWGDIKDFDSNKMAYYTCSYSIDESHGKRFINVEAKDQQGEISPLRDLGYLFLNPNLKINIDGNLNLSEESGQTIYSEPIFIENKAESPLFFNMSISGVDLVNFEEEPVSCNGKDFISIKNISYYTDNPFSAISSDNDPRASEGYIPLDYENQPILIGDNTYSNRYSSWLAPELKMGIKVKFDIPKECSGTFDKGYIKLTGSEVANPQINVSINIPINLKVTESNLIGDLNKDGIVNIDDVLIFVESFGKNEGEEGFSIICDLNNDGSIDVVDLLYLVDNLDSGD